MDTASRQLTWIPAFAGMTEMDETMIKTKTFYFKAAHQEKKITDNQINISPEDQHKKPSCTKPLFSVGSFKQTFRRFFSLRGNPREIALGFALGLFVGMSPYMMFHTVTAVFFASLFKWNKISAAAGVFITNPLTAPFFYRITYLVGVQFFADPPKFSFPHELTWESIMEMLRSTPDLLWVLTVGGIAAGIPAAIIGYYAAFWGIIKYRERRQSARKASRK